MELKELACVLCSLAFVFPALGTVLIETNQELPQNCLSGMGENYQECPARDEPLEKMKEKWEKLNKLCCGAYDGTVMHCQTGEFRNRTQYSILACLKDLLIPPGYIGVVFKNESGYPDIKYELCEDGYFRSGSINSSFLPFAYCTADKSNCDLLPGQEKACLEGPDKDDPCTCRPGFKAELNSTACSSVRGFFVEDNCFCQALEIAEYTVSKPPTSNPLLYCKNLPADQMKNWYRQNLQHTSPGPSATAVGDSTPKSSSTASSGERPWGNSTNNCVDTTNKKLLTAVIVVPILLFIIIVILICNFVICSGRKCKLNFKQLFALNNARNVRKDNEEANPINSMENTTETEV